LIVPSRSRSAGASSAVAVLISPTSPPAKKVVFPLVTMTPVTSSRSASRRSSDAVIAATYAAFMVLADWSGSSMVSVTTPSASRS
jgi:hypothetical protein